MLWWTLFKLSWQLRDADWMARERVLRQLSTIQHPKATRLIADCLQDERPEIRLAAAERLVARQDLSASAALFEAVQLPENTLPIRQAAQRALAALGPAILDAAAARMKDSACPARAEMAQILGELNDPRAAEHLATVLDDDDMSLRKEAVFSLGAIGSESSVKPLTDALRDSRWLVRAEAAEALGKVGDAKSLSALLDAAKDEKWTVRCSACKALARFADPRAIEALLGMMAAEADEFPERDEVRHVAAQMLGKIGAASATGPLLHCAADPEAADIAVESLRNVFRQSAAEIAEDDLKAVAECENFQQTEYIAGPEEEVRTSGAPIESSGQREIDCSDLRDLAAQELTRRADS
ncbi:MAG: HEAT repeat domain-containing protein [Planctomycetales bacterium]